MPHKCPYCDKEVKARGRKNHVRLMSGEGHGPKGEVPDTLADDVDGPENGDSKPSDDADAEEGESPEEGEEADSDDATAAEITAEDIGDTSPEGVDTGDDENDGLPFDPDDDDAIELDGSETIYVRIDGEVIEAEPEPGDYLLITDDGPVLFDTDNEHRYEVVTA